MERLSERRVVVDRELIATFALGGELLDAN
jgi:hypothetical protein